MCLHRFPLLRLLDGQILEACSPMTTVTLSRISPAAPGVQEQEVDRAPFALDRDDFILPTRATRGTPITFPWADGSHAPSFSGSVGRTPSRIRKPGTGNPACGLPPSAARRPPPPRERSASFKRQLPPGGRIRRNRGGNPRRKAPPRGAARPTERSICRAPFHRLTGTAPER